MKSTTEKIEQENEKLREGIFELETKKEDLENRIKKAKLQYERIVNQITQFERSIENRKKVQQSYSQYETANNNYTVNNQSISENISLKSRGKAQKGKQFKEFISKKMMNFLKTKNSVKEQENQWTSQISRSNPEARNRSRNQRSLNMRGQSPSPNEIANGHSSKYFDERTNSILASNRTRNFAKIGRNGKMNLDQKGRVRVSSDSDSSSLNSKRSSYSGDRFEDHSPDLSPIQKNREESQMSEFPIFPERGNAAGNYRERRIQRKKQAWGDKVENGNSYTLSKHQRELPIGKKNVYMSNYLKKARMFRKNVN